MSNTATLDPAPRAVEERRHPHGELAVLLQETFTAAARLRADRQVAADAEAFRLRIKQLLGAADQAARRAGYDPAHVKLAIYAFIAYLDESVLNSTQEMFAGWPRQPLQEEIFGDHMAGQTFFIKLDELLAATDSEDLADLLEVYQLCLLLGFRGRYASGDDGGLRGRIVATQEKIDRIRGGPGPFGPHAAHPTDDVIPASRDPWLPWLGATAAACFAGASLLYLIFRISLNGQVEQLRAMVMQLLQ
ncbi:MAG: DotU family type IV/VI secretion system protein [Gemmatimonas sp.]|nr:DotU family type IV/VI secretion system protein [Gemmatimonas sp.]